MYLSTLYVKDVLLILTALSYIGHITFLAAQIDFLFLLCTSCDRAAALIFNYICGFSQDISTFLFFIYHCKASVKR